MLCMVLEIALGYVAGKMLWEAALVGAHWAGRLTVRAVMRMTKEYPQVDQVEEHT